MQACVSLVQPDAMDHVDWLVGGILEMDLDSGWELAPSTPDQVKRLLADVNHIVGRIRLMNEKPGEESIGVIPYHIFLNRAQATSN